MFKEKKTKIKIGLLILLITYGLIGIAALAVGYHNATLFTEKDFVVGAVLLMSSIPHFFIFIFNGGFYNKRIIPYFIFSMFGFVFGIVAMSVKAIPVTTVCVVWGAFDICRSLYELIDIVPQIKKKKFLLSTEIAVSVGEIVLGVLLILHQIEGLKVHFKFIGFSFIVLLVNEIIILRVEKKNEESFDNN